MDVAAFTSHLQTPSSRFRLRQYFDKLATHDINIHDFYRKFSTQTASSNDGKRIRESPYLMTKASLHESANIFLRFFESLASRKFDIVWLSRQLIIGYPTFEFLLKNPLVYDIDDAIYLNSKFSYYQFKKIAERADVIVAGNKFLAEEAAKHNKNIEIIPTAVDTYRWKPIINEKRESESQFFRVGWSGTSSSFNFFLRIQSELKNFFVNFPNAEFLVMSDRFPNELKELKPFINYQPWSVDNEVGFVQSLDVGLMPLGEGIWSKGKCSYKMLLYAACGIPVVVSPVGMNQKILEEANIGYGSSKTGEWYEALEQLYQNQNLRKKLGANGVKLIVEQYSSEICGEKLINIFKTLR